MHVFDEHNNKVISAVGGAFPGYRAVFHGQDLHQDIVGKVGWIRLLSKGIGCELSDAQANFLEHTWVATSYPDARIWNNRIASLAGNARATPALAMASANAVSEALIYGRRNECRAVDFFKHVLCEIQSGSELAETVEEFIVKHKTVPGYGRPLHNGDERIGPFMQLGKQYGVIGDHVRLAFEIEEYLTTNGRNLKMNAGALISAFGADFGMDGWQWSTMMHTAFQAGMIPCYVEAKEKPVGAMFSYRCQQVDYNGPDERPW